MLFKLLPCHIRLQLKSWCVFGCLSYYCCQIVKKKLLLQISVNKQLNVFGCLSYYCCQIVKKKIVIANFCLQTAGAKTVRISKKAQASAISLKLQWKCRLFNKYLNTSLPDGFFSRYATKVEPQGQQTTLYFLPLFWHFSSVRFTISWWQDIRANSKSKLFKFTIEIRSQWPQP